MRASRWRVRGRVGTVVAIGSKILGRALSPPAAVGSPIMIITGIITRQSVSSGWWMCVTMFVSVSISSSLFVVACAPSGARKNRLLVNRPPALGYLRQGEGSIARLSRPEERCGPHLARIL
jgi:hypothetical protein